MDAHALSPPRQLTIFFEDSPEPPVVHLVFYDKGRLRFLDSGEPVDLPIGCSALLRPLQSSYEWVPCPGPQQESEP
jgi:hypothetical protein